MSDFTTRVHTDGHQLQIQLPDGMGPGDYVVTVSPAADPFLEVFPLETMNPVQRRFFELSKKLNLKPDPDFKFDRQDANSRS